MVIEEIKAVEDERDALIAVKSADKTKPSPATMLLERARCGVCHHPMGGGTVLAILIIAARSRPMPGWCLHPGRAVRSNESKVFEGRQFKIANHADPDVLVMVAEPAGFNISKMVQGTC